MGNRKRILLVLGNFGVMILAWVLGQIPYMKVYQEGHFATYLPLFISLVVDIVVASAFCLLVWFMLVQNAGDRIPPLTMLIIGLVGLALVPLYIYAGFYMSAPWLGYINSSPANITCALFIAFGIAGLFTRPKAK
jgi:hypothetical protein